MHNLKKTPTPTLFNADLVVGSTLIEGTLNTTNEDGSLSPEIGAYIYIYVNNILINEDSRTILSGEGRAGVTTVVEDLKDAPNLPSGYWSFSCKALSYGSHITVRAQAPDKALSDFSITYVVGGSPTPTNIVSLKSDGLFGPLVEGDTTIEGEFSGLKNYAYNAIGEYFYPYNKNLDLYPYIDGIKQKRLPYNKIIGQNFITDSLFATTDFDIDILVQGEPVNINMKSFSHVIFEEFITGITGNEIVYHPPTDTPFLMFVYAGGFRLAKNTPSVSYDYYLSHSITGEPLIILNSGFNPSPSEVFCIQYVGIAEDNSVNYDSLVFQGTTDEVYSIPYSEDYQVYKNGLRMLEGSFYDFTVTSDSLSNTTTITFNRQDGNNIILATDTIIIDFKVYDTFDPFYGLKALSYSDVTPSIVDTISNSISKRSFYLDINRGSFPIPTYISIYKNGVKQRLSVSGSSSDGDYTLQTTGDGYRATFFSSDEEPFSYTYIILDGIRIYTITNNFTVDLVYSDVIKEASLSYLNTLPAMVDNKITASLKTDEITGLLYIVFESPYTLEFPENSQKYPVFFGREPSLVPGKNETGHFKYFIDFKRNRWRYTFDFPLKKRMHITASTFPRS